MPEQEKKVCPECGHIFKGNGFDGIDAHWRAKHEHVMPYGEAWPQIKEGTYRLQAKAVPSRLAPPPAMGCPSRLG